MFVAFCSGLLGCKQREDVTQVDVVHEDVTPDFTPGGLESPEPPLTPHPPGWVLMDEKAFSFYAPPDIRSLPVKGIDSFVGKYQGDSITLYFDYGQFSSPLDDSNCTNYTSNVELIGGKNAKVASFHSYGENIVGVYFPSAGGKGIRLTFTATGKTQSDYETAKSIFRTIQFPHR